MQYTRIYIRANDEIAHICTQDSPFELGYEPLEDITVVEIWDLVMDSHSLTESQLKSEFIKKSLTLQESEVLISELKRSSRGDFVDPKAPKLSKFKLRNIDGVITINEFTRARSMIDDMEKIGLNQAPKFKAAARRVLNIRTVVKR